jgi:hypothetical protein
VCDSVCSKAVSAKKPLASEQCVSLSLIGSNRNFKYAKPILFKPRAEVTRLSLTFFVAEAGENHIAAPNETGIGGKDHVWEPLFVGYVFEPGS